MYKWLVNKCKESESFAWFIAFIGIVLMVIIYFI